MFFLFSQVKGTKSSKRSCTLCVCVYVCAQERKGESICNWVLLPAQHLLPPCARAGFPAFGSLRLLYSPTLSVCVDSNSVGDEAFPKSVFVPVRGRKRDRGRVEGFGETDRRGSGYWLTVLRLARTQSHSYTEPSSVYLQRERSRQENTKFSHLLKLSRKEVYI